MSLYRLTCTILFFATIAGHACADDDDNPRTISTTGDAVIYVQPNEAILTFGLQTISPDLATAKAENDTSSQKLTQAVKALGIEPKHFATDNVAVSLLYDTTTYARARATTITGYQVTRTWMVTLKDMSQLEPTIDTILSSGANIFEGVEFRTTELRKHRDAARQMAIKAAKEKAEGLAEVVNCTVGAPRTINESSGYWGMYRGSGRDFGSMMQNVAQEAPSASPVAEGDTLPLGQITVKATVSASFDLIPAPAISAATPEPPAQVAQ